MKSDRIFICKNRQDCSYIKCIHYRPHHKIYESINPQELKEWMLESSQRSCDYCGGCVKMSEKRLARYLEDHFMEML